MCCPGYHLQGDLALEDVVIDVYVSPHELVESGTTINRKVAFLVQSFGEHLALHHLQEFGSRCCTDSVVAPQASGKREELYSLSTVFKR
jgi:hypothetical protein